MRQNLILIRILYLLYGIDAKLNHILTTGGQLSAEDLASLEKVAKSTASLVEKANNISTLPPEPKQ